jgi:hypothetical protein
MANLIEPLALRTRFARFDSATFVKLNMTLIGELDLARLSQGARPPLLDI